MIAREGNQRTDSLAVSNRNRQPIATHIMISRILKKCSNGWVILGQFIPVKWQNCLASPSNDRIDYGILFLEIARLPRNRIRTNRAQQVRVLDFSANTTEHTRYAAPRCWTAIAFSACSRSGSSWPRIVSVSRIAAESIFIMLRIYAPHEYGRAPTPSPTACLHELVGGVTASEFARRLALPPTNSNAALNMSAICGNKQICRGAGT